MRSETNQQKTIAMKTKAIERMRRRRSSSKCSRKDICPPSCRPSRSSFSSVSRRVEAISERLEPEDKGNWKEVENYRAARRADSLQEAFNSSSPPSPPSNVAPTLAAATFDASFDSWPDSAAKELRA